ncbi:hypothetical protein GKQ23_07715 [Erwinia sp. E602]|uniref:hypothetical protein n=1 Tax=Erwinia sp. E602 TaxID=2675378 RepID=UPI001BA6473C|nr:hypothetical protein [Erwinia sp. E602]QUG74883.1 hypothetical protein GKQ23_07715 [Erwinia sp. E602]
MNHYAIPVSLLSAAIWLLLVFWLLKRARISRIAALLLAVLPLLAGNLLFYGWLQPQQQRAVAIADAQARLATQPVWRIIKVQQPALWQQANEQLVSQLRAGVQEKQATDGLRPLMAELLNQRVNDARDEDLLRYMQVVLEEMQQFKQSGSGLCFRYLFPQVEGGVSVAEVLPAGLVAREMRAMDSLLANSQAGQPFDASLGRSQLQTVVAKLYSRWGSDLQTLNAPAEADVDRGKLCDMTIDLYQSVLALPGKDAASVLRIIISGTGS